MNRYFLKPRRRNGSIRVALLAMFIGCAIVPTSDAARESGDGVWLGLTRGEIEAVDGHGHSPWIRPQRFSAVRLEPNRLSEALTNVPLELMDGAERNAVHLDIPTPDGGFETFAIVESPVAEYGLYRWMADQGWPMRTFKGRSLDTPSATVRLDFGGPAGFHATVLSPAGVYYVDPYWKGDALHYSSYYKRDLLAEGKTFECLFDDARDSGEAVDAGPSTNAMLRTYRLAVAATGEYTQFHGGTAVAGQAAIVTTVNRVNQVYERDVSIRMILIGNNQTLVYTNPATDPYTNNNGGAMLTENQNNLDSVIGNAGYDIGHVVSTGGGGVAYLGVPCVTGWKGGGVTGSSSPMGDPFDIDYVAHEMGHQWGGNHTFNSTSGSCSGNRTSTTAYEPGSGTTIQAYAGICGADNVQSNSDDFFHGVSLDQILTYAAGGGACSVNIPANNPNAPTVDAGPAYTIPANTPFELTVATAADLDGDGLTFSWEEWDLGPAASLAVGDNGSSPIFRAWPPTTSPTRVFPRASDLAAGTLATGETLPTTNRTMTFRVNVRDNAAGGGRVADDTTTVTSTTAAGPFQVTAPNGGENWSGTPTVTWNVASTNGGAVNTGNVDILLSTDGGLTWPTTLVAGTPNDGSEAVTIPAVSTTTARVKVKGAGNIFFDISDGNFSIGGQSSCRNPALALADPGTVTDDLVLAGVDTISDLNLSLDTSHTWVGDLTFTLLHVDTGTSVTVIDRPGFPASANGCSNADIVATLDDEAVNPVEDQCSGTPPAIGGTLLPNNPLSAFDGEAIGGTWRLSVSDIISPDSGTLNQWCIEATTGGVGNDMIFSDDFETNDTSAWSVSVP